jgi:hypothetical protein
MLTQKLRQQLRMQAQMKNQTLKLFDLVEGLHRLQTDSLNDEIRMLAKDGLFSRTAPDVSILLVHFAQLIEKYDNPIDF